VSLKKLTVSKRFVEGIMGLRNSALYFLCIDYLMERFPQNYRVELPEIFKIRKGLHL
jgi:hypothetical protein